MQNRGRFVMLASRQDQPTDDRSAVDSRRPVRQAAEDRFGSTSVSRDIAHPTPEHARASALDMSGQVCAQTRVLL